MQANFWFQVHCNPIQGQYSPLLLLAFDADENSQNPCTDIERSFK